MSGHSENLKFPPGRSKSTFQRPYARFCAKRDTPETIMHKNAIKHENIGFREFSALKEPKKFYPLSTRYLLDIIVSYIIIDIRYQDIIRCYIIRTRYLF